MLHEISPVDLPKDAATRNTLQELAATASKKPICQRTAEDFRAMINVAAMEENWIAVRILAFDMAHLHKDTPKAYGFALFAKACDRGQRELSQLIILTRFDNIPLPELKELAAKTLVGMGVDFGEIEDREAAIATYDEVVTRFGANPLPALQEQVAQALVFKGEDLEHLERPEEAIAAYDEAVMRFDTSPLPALQELVARALFYKAWAYATVERVADCVETLREWRKRVGTIDCSMIEDAGDFDQVRGYPQFVAFLAENGCHPKPALG